jgi:hypothetical protein
MDGNHVGFMIEGLEVFSKKEKNFPRGSFHETVPES